MAKTKKELKEELNKVYEDIRSKCVDCQGHQWSLVDDCQLTECPLYKHRMKGKHSNN